ncbi:UDP-N-acetylglucosamine--dolichyl-phosphate N-acetylglucosaminephosphotransferase [Nematocida sp. AWRm77]|nr:UDP-N-acetylglucosamine--dolichyl-phosphate N-acetylglucosaminephosphotransferase [Nematocida sp. AWRm77]
MIRGENKARTQEEKKQTWSECSWKVLVPVLFGVLSYKLCAFVKKKTRISGVDMHKKEKPRIPEGTGLGAGICFICSVFSLSAMFPEYKEPLLISACAVSLNLLLGYVDDTMELNWACKIIFPWIALCPMIMTYSGSTQMIVPFWGRVELGSVFYAFLVGLSIFFTNAVNILSGINGVEAGQVLVISGFMFVDRLLFVDETSEMSALLSLSLFFCTGGLFIHNRYPSQCFVGDTFCYFSGSAVLCLGVLGGFTKTVFLFFIPQIVNFALSAPQILGVVPCPRHRLPQMVVVSRTGKDGQERKQELLVPSVVSVMEKTALPKHPNLQRMCIQTFEKLGLASVEYSSIQENKVQAVSNFTLLNCVLVHTGPLSEPALFNTLMSIQSGVCGGVILAKLIGRWVG